MFCRNIFVGTDGLGNRYYKRGKRRLVCYASGNSDPTQVSPAWYLWLHHAVDSFPKCSFDNLELHFSKLDSSDKSEVNASYVPWRPE